MQIVNATLDQYSGIDTQLQQLRDKKNMEQITGRYYSEQAQQLENKRNALRMDAMQQIQATRTAYQTAAEQAALVDGSMLHEDAKLLSLDGLTLTPSQFDALVTKHQNNPLMCQLLKDYSTKHEGLYSTPVHTVEDKTTAFNGFTEAANSVLRNPSTIQRGFFQDGAYTPASCTEAE